MTPTWETKRASLDQLFAPKRIALIGATNKLNKWGGMIQANVRMWEEKESEARERVLYGILGLMKDLDKPVVTVMGREPTPRFDALLRREGLSLYPTPERAVRVMARLMEYAHYRRRWEQEP